MSFGRGGGVLGVYGKKEGGQINRKWKGKGCKKAKQREKIKSMR
jgi:hypothetical protein